MTRAEWQTKFDTSLKTCFNNHCVSYDKRTARLLAAVEACGAGGGLWQVARYTWHGNGSKYKRGDIYRNVPSNLPFSEEILKEARALPAEIRCRYTDEQDWRDLAAHFRKTPIPSNRLLLL